MAAMTRKRANSLVEYKNLHMFTSVVLLSLQCSYYYNRNLLFTHKRLKNLAVLVLADVRCALLEAHDGFIFHCRDSGKSNRLVPQKNTLTKMISTQKERRRNKLFKDVFGACFVEIWPFEFCIF